MTDPRDPLHSTDELDPLDELASAHLDGHSTPEQAARVAGDPDLVARIARLDAVRAAVRDAPIEPVGAARREQALATAMQAFDAAAPPAPVTAPANVTPLAARWRTSRRTLQLAGIAAAVALLALAVPLLGRLDDGSDDDASDEAATALERSPAAEGGAADGASPDDAAGADSPTTMAAAVAVPTPLGSFRDAAALAAAVRAQLDEPAIESTGPQDAATYTAPSCMAELTERAPSPRLLVAATLDGLDVVGVVHDDDTGRAVLDVLDAASCALVTTIVL